MNLILFNIILSSLLLSSNCGNIIDKKWLNFKLKYSKPYKNSSGDAYRWDIWKSKNQLIVEQNKKFEKGLETYTLGDNYFMDYVGFFIHNCFKV